MKQFTLLYKWKMGKVKSGKFVIDAPNTNSNAVAKIIIISTEIT